MTGTAKDHRHILESHGLFGGLSSAELDRVLSFARIETHRARETIFLKGSPGRGLLAVLKGRVQIRAPGVDGREVTLNIIDQGEVFGEIALLDGRERSADAVAMTNCELLVIDRREFVPFLKQNAEIALRLMAVLCDRLRRTTEQVEDLLFLNLASRLAKKLLSLAAGGDRHKKGVTLKHKLSQRELANLVGFSRESVNKQLAAWQKSQLISIADGNITLLDETQLQGIADSPD
ncbi:MAG: Crp/Fnr family transcriptional regulator [Proteobacteria bacterium]|nr:Crp/Fnr family transcriptional regulator [Pseudomonadota bacterium]MBI3498263.1 Crp/Fnr family transcriptional regulator [Pseudomonadota bacterium]